jgi:hypothetical protein
MKEEKKDVEAKDQPVKWAVGQIPTATKEVIVNTATQQPLTTEVGIAILLNELEEVQDTLNKILKKLS